MCLVKIAFSLLGLVFFVNFSILEVKRPAKTGELETKMLHIPQDKVHLWDHIVSALMNCSNYIRQYAVMRTSSIFICQKFI